MFALEDSRFHAALECGIVLHGEAQTFNWNIFDWRVYLKCSIQNTVVCSCLSKGLQGTCHRQEGQFETHATYLSCCKIHSELHGMQLSISLMRMRQMGKLRTNCVYLVLDHGAKVVIPEKDAELSLLYSGRELT